MAQPRPLSTAELGKLADVQVDSNTPIRLYIRSAALLIKQARVYSLERDLQHAYILYMKYTNLGLKGLPSHTGYATADKKAIRAIKQNCLEALEALETMKPTLDDQYESFIEKQPAPQRETRSPPGSIAQPHDTAETSPPPSQTGENHQHWSLQEELQGVAGIGHSALESQPYEAASKGTQHIHYPNDVFHNQSDSYAYPQPSSFHETSPSIVKPPLPPKPSLLEHPAPELPPKIKVRPDQPSPGPALPPKIKLDQDTQPRKELESTALVTGATTERGLPLRPLLVSHSLQRQFLDIAQKNTERNIETCGILAGTLHRNVLKVTTLIIPKQTGTSDTCTTENEEELFEYQDKHDLLTFGWIHTHPSQSCFLSSVDLHTHCSYQLMLSEAIAIVCAPKKTPNFGIFRLTDPPGLDVISSCRHESLFHPHADLPIYTNASKPGHVRLEDYSIKVVDLRCN